MSRHILTMDQLVLFQQHLAGEEREQSTIEKYIREIRFFQTWLTGRLVTTEIVASWKSYLRAEGYQPETINSKLSALNKFFSFIGWAECRMKYLKIQRKLFRGTERESVSYTHLTLPTNREV